jgi:hypothetical protein
LCRQPSTSRLHYNDVPGAARVTLR